MMLALCFDAIRYAAMLMLLRAIIYLIFSARVTADAAFTPFHYFIDYLLLMLLLLRAAALPMLLMLICCRHAALMPRC